MKILFVTAHKYLPQMHGGLQASTDQLCRALIERGHSVAVLAGLMPNGLFSLIARVKMQMNKRIGGCKVARMSGLSYPVWFSWFPWETVEYVTHAEKPDLIVVMAMQPVRMALAARQTGVPVLMQLQDVEFEKHGGNYFEVADLPCVANSQFTASRYHEAYGAKSVVIPPFISSDDYRTHSTRENVTFINPVKEKGLDIALAVARRCPEIPFVFVETWPLTLYARVDLLAKLEDLPNVQLVKPEDDMRRIYGKCKILLAPSRWDEGYGRVVTEAQMSGIPVIASTRGGLPEAVGTGGVVLNPDAPIDDWVAAVQKFWHDQSYYNDQSGMALAYSNRPSIQLNNQLEAWDKTIRQAARANQNAVKSGAYQDVDKLVPEVARANTSARDVAART